MGAKEKVYESEIEQDGIFDFKKLYNFAYDFLKSKGFDVIETSYSEKVGGEGKEIEVKWEIEKKVTDYIKYIGKVKMTLKNLKSVEVQKDGKKENSNKGSIKVAVSGEVETDYGGKWDSTPTLQFMRGIYDKFVIKKRVGELTDAYAGDLDDFIGQLKSFLVLEGIK